MTLVPVPCRSYAVSSPTGYESFDELTVARQVVTGGKNKYLINGRTVQQSQVANFFHSVQLNVNNPHFLIMQASQTKAVVVSSCKTNG